MGLLEIILNKNIESQKRSIGEEEKEEKSLLLKANEVLDFSEEDLKEKEFDLPLFSSQLKEIKNDIARAGRIFALLKEHLCIKKGALLIAVPKKNHFIPYASAGYDETTKNRLKITFEAKKSLLSIPGKYLFSKKELSSIRSAFSLREFAILEKAILFPIVHDDTDIGLILISDIGGNVVSDHYLSFLKKAAEFISPALMREIPDLTDEGYKTDMRGLKNFYDSFTAGKTVGETSYFIDFCVSELDRQLKKSEEEISFPRVKTEIINILNALTGGKGKIFSCKNRIILIFDSKSIRDKNLLAHQFSLSIKRVIPENITLTSPLFKIYSLTADKDKIEDLIAAANG